MGTLPEWDSEVKFIVPCEIKFLQSLSLYRSSHVFRCLYDNVISSSEMKLTLLCNNLED